MKKQERKLYKDSIRERYLFEGPDQLAKEFGKSRRAIIGQAWLLGVKSLFAHRRGAQTRAQNCESLNWRYFDQWTQEGAYVLGFTQADGSVRKDLLQLQFGLHPRDRCVLDFIKQQLMAKTEVGIRQKRDGSWRAVLNLSNHLLVRAVVEKGILPRKSYIDPPFPEIPEQYFRRFVLGFFDGDGTVKVILGRRKNPEITIAWLGGERLLSQLRDKLVERLGLSYRKLYPEKNIKVLQWAAKEDVRKIFVWMYEDGEFCLERKREKIRTALEMIQ